MRKDNYLHHLHLDLHLQIIAISAVFFSLTLAIPSLPSWAYQILTLCYCITTSLWYGGRFLTSARLSMQFLYGAVLLIGYLGFILSLALITTRLTLNLLQLLTIIAPLLPYAGARKAFHSYEHSLFIPLSPLRPYVHLISLVSIASIGLLILLLSQTIAPAVSPWPLVPTIIFTIMTALAGATMLTISSDRYASWYTLIPLFTLALSVTTIVFPLGYGFDPLIHEATLRLLLTDGTLTPLPIYYLGYYSLNAWLVSVAHLPLIATNAFFSILLAIILLPLAITNAFRYLQLEKKYFLFAPVGLLLLPYGYLIQSTPQAASFVLSFVTVMSMVLYRIQMLPWWLLIAISCSAALLHPLTGIPLVLLTLYLIVYQSPNQNMQKILLRVVIGACALLIVPLLIILASKISPEFTTNITFNIPLDALRHIVPEIYRFTTFDDLIYSALRNVTILWALLALLGFWSSTSDTRSVLKPFIQMTLLAALGSLLLLFGMNIRFATPHEELAFAQRLFTLALILLSPLSLKGFTRLVSSAAHNRLIGLTTILIIALLISVVWYGSYPRFDTRVQDNGYTASIADSEAVRWIDRDAGTEPYIVLTNQTMSAVAIRTFGFPYYHHDIFYYPVPTNGPLYTRFLEAMNPEQRLPETIAHVRSLTGVSRIYVAVHDYWSQSEKLRVLHGAASSRKTTFNEHGRVDVFVYE